MRSASRPASVWLRPARGSSRSRRRGAMASARPISRRFCTPSGRVAARRSARSAMPSRPSSSLARRRAASRPVRSSAAKGREVSAWAAASATFSTSVMSGKGRTSWWVIARPRRARACTGARVTSCPSKRTSPAPGRTMPVSRRTRVVLPGSVRPDEAHQLALLHRDIDPANRAHPAEGDAQVPGLEQAHVSTLRGRVRRTRSGSPARPEGL